MLHNKIYEIVSTWNEFLVTKHTAGFIPNQIQTNVFQF